MVHAVHGAATEEAEVVGDLGEVRPIVRHVRAAPARLDESERALHVVTFAAFHRGLLLALTHELLEVQLFECRLGIEGIEVRWPTFHHEEDDILGLGVGEVDLFGRKRLLLGLLGEQRAEGHAAETGAQAIDKISAC